MPDIVGNLESGEQFVMMTYGGQVFLGAGTAPFSSLQSAGTALVVFYVPLNAPALSFLLLCELQCGIVGAIALA